MYTAEDRESFTLDGKATTDALLAWRNVFKGGYPMMALVARVVLCVTATEFSVERIFSRVARILTDSRSSMSVDVLDKLIVLVSNAKRVGVMAST